MLLAKCLIFWTRRTSLLGEIDMNELTWTCHICGTERPDKFISVHTKSSTIGTEQAGYFRDQYQEELSTVKENIRYCNDNPDCKKKAKTFSFFNIEK